MSLLRHRLAPALLLLLACLSLSVGIAELPVQDRDEARFAQASRQMAETGDLIDIRFQTRPRHNKPALIYWAQTAAIWIAGAEGNTPIWLHRLPSLLSGIAAVLALFWASKPLIGRPAALLAGVICATIYMVHAEARTAKTDAMLLLTVIVSMGVLARAWLGELKGMALPAVFWIAIACGFLLKGPMVALPVIGAIAWCWLVTRDLSWLTSLKVKAGLILFLAVVAPWFIAITIVTEGAFWNASVGTDLTNKLTAGGEHSGSPIGLYLMTIWLTMWPWCLLIPMALVYAWRNRSDRRITFLIGWLVPGWIVFELVPVKLVHYTLPLYPPLIALAAAALLSAANGKDMFPRWTKWVGTFGFLLGLVFFVGIAALAPVYFGEGFHLASSVAAGIVFALALAAMVFLWRSKWQETALALTGAGLLVGWSLTAISLPAASDFRISDRVVAATAEHECLRAPIAMAGYGEPSIVFLNGTETILTDIIGALEHLGGGPNRAAWISRDLISFEPEPGIEGVTEVSGRNFANLREVNLRLFVSPGIVADADFCQSAE